MNLPALDCVLALYAASSVGLDVVVQTVAFVHSVDCEWESFAASSVGPDVVVLMVDGILRMVDLDFFPVRWKDGQDNAQVAPEEADLLAADPWAALELVLLASLAWGYSAQHLEVAYRLAAP
mmetsp:Transcript_12368/g.30232  ORF Transcript_12368/g.30232 Transcript_12368/m.30232 type:complete len:122 (-) Transcript_12368:93-458(-)